MTDEEIIALWVANYSEENIVERVKSFARAIIAAERERCAQVCDRQASEPECPERARYCAEAIRAKAKEKS